jgi:CRP-like cAMP-binding protein
MHTPTAPYEPQLPAEARQEILAYISNFATLSEGETQAILESLNPRLFKKGAFLVREGQAKDLCYFVLKGCVRQYYLVDGEEKTTHFYTEGQPITPFEGTHKGALSKYYLSCMEDCILSVGAQDRTMALFEQFPRLSELARLATEEELGKSQDNFASFIIHSPEERYLHLLDTRPDLLDRVPQYHLASFLGIKPESLSRIRKRLAKK